MISTEPFKRAAAAFTLLSCAAASVFTVRHAIAGKMVFSGGSDQAFDLDARVSPENGVLTLNPSGSSEQAVRVEILAPSGRSPASLDLTPTVLKRLTVSGPTTIDLAELTKAQDRYHNLSSPSSTNPSVIRIRILAP